MLAKEIQNVLYERYCQNNPKTFYPRPSLAGLTQCSRQLYYKLKNFEPDKMLSTPRMAVVLDDSSWHEELTLNALRQSNKYEVYGEQTEILCGVVNFNNQPFELKGHIDGIVKDKTTGQKYLLEHKALNTFGFTRYEKLSTLPIDYFTQCVLYSKGLQELDSSVNHIILLIKNKNTGAYLEFKMQYNAKDDVLTISEINTSEKGNMRQDNIVLHGIYEQAINRFNQIDNATEPPERVTGEDVWQCDYCVYESLCYKTNSLNSEAKEEKNKYIELPSEYETVLQQYFDAVRAEKFAKEQKEEAIATIKNYMENIGKAQKASFKDTVIQIYSVSRETIDKDKLKQILSPEEFAKVVKTSTYTNISIKKAGGR